jgi:hypothetical protein
MRREVRVRVMDVIGKFRAGVRGKLNGKGTRVG